MFKPHKAQCIDCPPGTESLIVVKAGRCAKHNHEFKQKKKGKKAPMGLDKMKKAGYIKRAIDLETDYKDVADRLFSIWIRRKDADKKGWVKCITCPDKKHWKRMTCGHFMKRRHTATRYLDQACKPQCFDCQRLVEENPLMQEKFRDELIKLHGIKVVEEIEALKNTELKMSRDDYKELCAELKLKIDAL